MISWHYFYLLRKIFYGIYIMDNNYNTNSIILYGSNNNYRAK